MWNSELDNLSEQYLEYKDSRQRLMDGEDSKTTKKKVVSKGDLVINGNRNYLELNKFPTDPQTAMIATGAQPP